MWKICKGYSAYDLGELKEIDASQLPLDPVEVAGSARLPRLLYHAQRLSILFAETALQLIMCPSTFMKMVEPRITNYDPGKARMVAEKWTDHFKTLLDENDESPPAERRTLCARVNISRVLFVSTYFAIPKDPTVCRAIVNGRRFSEICNPPPRVNLPDLAWVLKLLVGVFANACPFMSIGDIRHWFHQLSIHHEIARWFALRLSKDEFVVWKRLAMGWSWSPYIAQCIAFLIILIVLKELDEDISEYVNLVIPPPVIILRNKNGAIIAVIALWYDNIGLFTTASALNDKFFNGLYRFCSQDSLGCGVVLKIWQLFGHRNLSTSNDKEKYPFPGYVGVEFAWQRNLESVQQLSWRVEQKRLERWKLASTWIQRRTTTTNFSQCTDSNVSFIAISPRRLSKIVGIILYYYHIRLVALCEISEVLGICRDIQVAVQSERHGWDCARYWPDQKMALLQNHLQIVMCNQWFFPVNRQMDGEVWAASDASDFAYGFVIMRPWCEAHPREFPDEMIDAHIFVKELFAAERTVAHICAKKSNRVIHLLMDNTAATGVLRRMFSLTEAGLAIAKRVHKLLTDSGNTLNIIHVTSKENPADAPSRRVPIIAELIANGEAIVVKGKMQHHGLTMPQPPYDMSRKRERAERHEEIEAPRACMLHFKEDNMNPFEADERLMEIATDDNEEDEDD